MIFTGDRVSGWGRGGVSPVIACWAKSQQVEQSTVKPGMIQFYDTYSIREMSGTHEVVCSNQSCRYHAVNMLFLQYFRGWVVGCSCSTLIACWAAGQQVAESILHLGYSKIHLISPDCTLPSSALQRPKTPNIPFLSFPFQIFLPSPRPGCPGPSIALTVA